MNCYRYVKKSIQLRRLWLNSLKDQPCADCGIKYIPCVMEWHHLDPTTKNFGPGRGSFRSSREKILEEIAKCILLCANCHRIREFYSRENGYSSLSHKQTSASSTLASATISERG